MDCGEVSPREAGVRRCKACPGSAGRLRPNTISFSEPLDPAKLEAARSAFARCDLVLIVGTSVKVPSPELTQQVAPVNQLPGISLSRGVPLVVFNMEETSTYHIVYYLGLTRIVYDQFATIVVRAPAAAALAKVSI